MFQIITCPSLWIYMYREGILERINGMLAFVLFDHIKNNKYKFALVLIIIIIYLIMTKLHIYY